MFDFRDHAVGWLGNEIKFFIQSSSMLARDLRRAMFHSSEIVYAYDNLHTIDRPWEEIDKTLANQMSTYFANFIKTGNPNGKGLANWPFFNSTNEKILIIDKNIESKKLETKDQLALIASLLN